jgi:hypothetical protein
VLAVGGMTLGLLDRRAENLVIGPTGPKIIASGMTPRRDQHAAYVVARTSARPELREASLLNAAAVRSNLTVLNPLHPNGLMHRTHGPQSVTTHLTDLPLHWLWMGTEVPHFTAGRRGCVQQLALHVLPPQSALHSPGPEQYFSRGHAIWLKFELQRGQLPSHAPMEQSNQLAIPQW